MKNNKKKADKLSYVKRGNSLTVRCGIYICGEIEKIRKGYYAFWEVRKGGMTQLTCSSNTLSGVKHEIQRKKDRGDLMGRESLSPSFQLP